MDVDECWWLAHRGLTTKDRPCHGPGLLEIFRPCQEEVPGDMAWWWETHLSWQMLANAVFHELTFRDINYKYDIISNSYFKKNDVPKAQSKRFKPTLGYRPHPAPLSPASGRSYPERWPQLKLKGPKPRAPASKLLGLEINLMGSCYHILIYKYIYIYTY